MTFAPRTWVVGEVVSAALMNQEIRDQINEIIAAWTAYTPAWTAASTNPVLGNGTLTGRHMKVGRTCHAQIDLVTGSTTTYGSGAYSMSLPFTAAAVGQRCGLAHVFLSQRYLGETLISVSATTALIFFPASGSVSNLSQAASNVPFTWANGTQLRVTLEFETI